MLRFSTFTSDIDLPFYTSLASHKINHDKLDDSARRLLGLYEIRATDPPEASCRLQINGNALTNDALVVCSLSWSQKHVLMMHPEYRLVIFVPKE